MADSSRWCSRCQKWGDHHTDRCPVLDAEEYPPGSVRWTIRALRRAREVSGPHLIIPRELVEAAEGHLDELYGPAFKAWRCDECGKVVTQETYEATIGMDYGYVIEMHSRLGIKVHVADWSNDGIRLLVNGGHIDCDQHGPMRHVVCRVTADDPASYPPASDPRGGTTC